MTRTMTLDGDDWLLTGWHRHQWRFTGSMETGEMLHPDVGPIPASVPGAVQNDLLAAGLIEDPRIGLASRNQEWTERREWFYEKSFEVPEPMRSAGVLQLVFEGLDCRGEIHLNGMSVGRFDNMHIPLVVDITDHLRPDGLNALRVVFETVPDDVDGQYGYSSRQTPVKARFPFVWDWTPRMVPTGIWRSVHLRAWNAVSVDDLHAESRRASEDAWTATVSARHEVRRSGEYRFRIVLKDSGGAELFSEQWSEFLDEGIRECSHFARFEGLRAWEPAGSGDQNLYELEWIVTDDEGELCDSRCIRTGFRDIALTPNPGAPGDALAYTLRVNGRDIFMKGVNWVPLSPWYGTVRTDEIRGMLKRYRHMGVTLLRIWGGAGLESEEFYNLCDEMGFLVWQEFPQSSSGLDNEPPSDAERLEVLRGVADSFLTRRRHHPSLVLWCGGNELMEEGYRPVGTDHPNIAMLASLVAELSPGTPFLPTSASGPRFCATEEDFGRGVHHDVHGPWLFDGPQGHFRHFNRDDALLRSECGCPAPSRLEQLGAWRGAFSLWPPSAANPYWVHRGSWWLPLESMSELFGPWEEPELPRLLNAARFIQAEALRYAADATMARRPAASGFLVWMGHDPFPNNANTSVIEYDGVPKPAYQALTGSWWNPLLHAKLPGLVLPAGSSWPLRIIAECPAGSDGAVRVRVFDGRGMLMHESLCMLSDVVEPSLNLMAGTVDLPAGFPAEGDAASAVRILRLERLAGNRGGGEDGEAVETVGTAAGGKDYVLVSGDPEGPHPLAPLRRLDGAQLSWEHSDAGEWVLANTSAVAAVGVALRERDPDDVLNISGGYLTLLPGERRIVTIRRPDGSIPAEPPVWEGLNV